ncbi:MAG: acyl-CoA dehydrogenase [Gammaproteobacteria bacterium]
MITLLWIIIFLAALSVLAYKRAALSVYSITLFLLTLFCTNLTDISLVGQLLSWLCLAIILIPLNILPLRRHLLTKPILAAYQKNSPKLSATEQAALTTGTVGWEGELLTGMPNWQKFTQYTEQALTEEELAFIQGPVETFCAQLDNWKINHIDHGLSPESWQFLKDNGFFGLVIPKKYGGKQFSAKAHAMVLTKIASRSNAAATIVGVPNSLGPAELLLEYGTEAQKDYYLPRLARGEEIPCFALTSPEAGSDASSMTDYGRVCRGQWQGEEVMGIELHWNKRYITLAPVATLLGLAFKLYDPNHLLGQQTDLGITCALIAVDTPGITIGRHHIPLYSAFPNGPTQGAGVFVPLDHIIGGEKRIGQGWQMLMERLAVGRGITLPAMSVGGAKFATAVSSAYTRIRKQFHVSLSQFEGVSEIVAAIAGQTYLMQALQRFTLAAIDRHEQPTIPSAISKYQTTESARRIINHAMDLQGGKGICVGPNNTLAQSYLEAPISITVEGSNVLTRNMIIFGQGVMRCHPYIFPEWEAAHQSDSQASLKTFDRLIWAHAGYLISNTLRTILLGITQGALSSLPGTRETKRYYRQLNRFSAVFALLSDVVLLKFGGSFKRHENLSGRLADIWSLLYSASALLKCYEADGSPAEDLPLLAWACHFIFYQLTSAIEHLVDNLGSSWLSAVLRDMIFPFKGRRQQLPSDALNHQVSQLLQNNTETRSRLLRNICLPTDLEDALKKIIQAEPAEKKFSMWQSQTTGISQDFAEQLEKAVQQEIITEEEAQWIQSARQARTNIIQVDDFA